jgi:hypothetical protein
MIRRGRRQSQAGLNHHVLALLALLPLAGTPAGVYFEQVTHSGPAGGPSGAGVVSRVWYAGRKMRLEAGGSASDSALILRLDRGLAYRLDAANRTATTLDLERLRAHAQLDAALAGDLMGGGSDTARTSPLPSERRIAGHTCRGFQIAAGATVLHVYVARDLPLGVEAFAEFLDWSGAGSALGGLGEEIRKLPGFPLETRSRVTVHGVDQQTVTTITRLELGPQPDAVFEPPAGFRIQPEAP